MKQYLHLIQNEFPSVSESDLYSPIRETPIDSFDLIIIRAALEKHFNLVIADSIWFQYQTLAEALEYFHKNKNENEQKGDLELKEIVNLDSVEIRMPQMANSALSENWLLKYIGDTHWLLISKGLGKKSSEFKNDSGDRLYATFIRINISTSPLSDFRENDIITFDSEIIGYGSNTHLTHIEGHSGDNKIKANLITTFSSRKIDDNSKIEKGTPHNAISLIKQLKTIPVILGDYRLLRKGLLDEIPSDFGCFQNTDDSIFDYNYYINPYYEINGVGLLYFASYPIISDKCIVEYFCQQNSNINYSCNYQTIYRDIYYFANCNPDDSIIFHLNSVNIEEKIIKTLTSLNRESDNMQIAKIITVKRIIK